MKERPCLDWGVTHLIINMRSPSWILSNIQIPDRSPGLGLFVPPEDG